MSAESSSVFQKKYEEFASELLSTFPELATNIQGALALSPDDRIKRFKTEINMIGSTDTTVNPGVIMPGISIPEELWNSLSDSNKKAIYEYVKLLSMCSFLEGGFDGDSKGKEWMDDLMKDWKGKLDSVDFEGLMGKFAKVFAGNKDASGNGFTMPQLPEKFLKGHLAKLAEEIVRDIKPEDLGLTQEMIDECEKSPSRAFTILVQVFTKNPGAIQGTIKKIGNRLQQKVQSGAIRPQEIAREAEELMKEFASNPQFVDVMESIKSMFGFEDMDLARQAGREGSARLSAVQQRLRKKLEAKKVKNAGAK
jgi:hypothetical protein